jgi:hypothetical protein
LKTRSNAFVALIGLDGQWDMSPANFRKTHVGLMQRYTIGSTLLLQFAVDTLPSLTLVNVVVEGTRFG